jgi:hypothetical protein
MEYFSESFFLANLLMLKNFSCNSAVNIVYKNKNNQNTIAKKAIN